MSFYFSAAPVDRGFFPSSWPYLLNLAKSVKCRGVEPSCLMIKWCDLQPAPAWEC